MTEREWHIYTLSDPRTGQVRYVGVTFRGKARFREHLSRAVTGGKTHRDNWIRSLIAINLRPVYLIIETGRGDGWQEAERHWIARYRETSRLTNLTDGGDGSPGYVPALELRAKWRAMRAGVSYPVGRIPGMRGKHHTSEAREKIRQAGMGRKHTAETKIKLSRAHRGKVLTPEHIEKMAAAKRGKRHTPEHNTKIAASTMNRKPVICVETGQMFESITAAARALSVNESSVYQAIRKGCRCRGYHFRLM